MAYKKVMVAFDGSEDSISALKHAIGQPEFVNGELCIVTVVNGHERLSGEVVPGQTQPIGSIMYPVNVNVQPNVDHENMERLRKQRENEVHQEGERVLAPAMKMLMENRIKYKTEILEGEPAHSIGEFALTNDFDLIIIGSRGLSGLKKLMLGSVSQKVVQEAECPVLVVK